MKKIFLAVLGFLSLSVAFAANTQTGYYTSQHKTSNAANYATDITVYNNTYDYVLLDVPNSPVHDAIRPYTPDHIYHDTYYGPTEIRLSSPRGQVFFDQYVSHYAYVQVSLDYYGRYVVDVTNKA